MKLNLIRIVLFVIVLAPAINVLSANKCRANFDTKATASSHVQALVYDMPGLEVASVTDPTLSTGATLFYFPQEALVNFDARGGSVASTETTLFAEGSYSAMIDGIVFAGGSTMGLAAADGVREAIFKQRTQDATAFDFIPSVPAAVVYDFGARTGGGQDALVYPNREMGLALMQNRSKNQFNIGRAGAGISTTVNKISKRIWGGQGAAFQKFEWGSVFVAVILNSMGDIQNNGRSLATDFLEVPGVFNKLSRENTTLSVVITDLALDRNQLKRLAITGHTSMASTIHPFHTAWDGDIQFTVGLGQRKLPSNSDDSEEVQLKAAMAAADLLHQAMVQAVLVSNAPEKANSSNSPQP